MSRLATERDEPADPAEDQPPPRDDHAFPGHPRGLATLSGLEVWERFSFLGMQAILVLYFADTVAGGGLGMSPGTAASVSAAYGTMVYLVSVAGGWLADRILGSYRAVLWGGILIACGHCAMAVPTAAMTWAGLGLISAGTGLLKPNVATMVGKLHRTDDDRRDAGFALSYMARRDAQGRVADRRRLPRLRRARHPSGGRRPADDGPFRRPPHPRPHPVH